MVHSWHFRREAALPNNGTRRNNRKGSQEEEEEEGSSTAKKRGRERSRTHRVGRRSFSSLRSFDTKTVLQKIVTVSSNAIGDFAATAAA